MLCGVQPAEPPREARVSTKPVVCAWLGGVGSGRRQVIQVIQAAAWAWQLSGGPYYPFQRRCLIFFLFVHFVSTLPNSLIGSKFSFDFLRLSNSPGITESAPYRIAFLNFMVVCLRCLLRLFL